ncbi:MAG: response regulator [Planctomycetes bacterium]|nr:response regulator [Planctomycetota bacterium]
MFQSFRILLVEDNDSLRACLCEFLASNGWDVTATAEGEEAMGLAAQLRFDFTILDYHLPGITGLELFRQLAASRPLPAILMSGLASTEEILAARDAGFFSFLRKPLELGALRSTVEQLIRTHFGGPLTRTNLPPGRPTISPPQKRPRPSF